MLNLLFNRLIQSIIVLFFLSLVLFGSRQMLGDPILAILPLDSTKEQIAAAREFYGLDKPLPEQYWIWLSKAAQGDMGMSLTSRQPAMKLFMDRLPASALLSAFSLLFSLAIGIFFGVTAGIYRNTWLHDVVGIIAVSGQSIPGFWVAIMLVELLSVQFRILPAAGAGTPLHIILPAISMSTFSIAAVTRLQRASMLEVLDSEFVKLARIKGVPEWRVILKHALRNALIPVATFGGMFFAIHIGFAVVIEQVFAWPGVGRLALGAAIARDYPVLQASVLMFALIVMVANVIVDLLYGILDPRIRLRG